MTNFLYSEPLVETETGKHASDTDVEVECPRCDDKGVLRYYRGGRVSVLHDIERMTINGTQIAKQKSICFFLKEDDGFTDLKQTLRDEWY